MTGVVGDPDNSGVQPLSAVYGRRAEAFRPGGRSMHLVNQSSLARTCIVASLSLVLAAVLALVAQAPAHASDQVQRHTYHQGFNKSGTTRFYTPNICIRWTVSGVLNYRANHIIRTDDVSGQKAHAYAIDRVNLSTNSLTVRGRKPQWMDWLDFPARTPAQA